MNGDRLPQVRRWARIAGWAGVGAAVLWAVLAWRAPAAAWPAYRFAIFACLQPPIGCLIFKIIHRITGGQWGQPLSATLDAGIRLLPWMWPLAAALVFFPWARPIVSGAVPPSSVPSLAGLIGRAVFYEIVFIVLCSAARRPWGRTVCPPGLVLLVFTLHFLAADWFFTLDPQWYSTGFPLVWMSIQTAAGLALCIAVAAACGRRGDAVGSSGRPAGLDWGDLIMTTVIFSTYVAFVEFLIIWAGDLPREISFYLQRHAVGWKAVAAVLGLFHLGFPVAFMLFRDFKRSRWGVAGVAALLCAVEVLWAAWFILPAFPDRGSLFAPLCALALLAGAGLFINRFLAAVLAEEGAR